MSRPLRIMITSFLVVIAALVLSACSSSQAGKTGGTPTELQNGATRAIEAYIQALSKQDAAQLSNLSCSSWEADALVEMDSLAGVGSKVENLTCHQTEINGTDTYVACSGDLALDYNGEVQQIDLSKRTYIARQEAGEWRMCGYR